jgi:hypothetical protein
VFCNLDCQARKPVVDGSAQGDTKVEAVDKQSNVGIRHIFINGFSHSIKERLCTAIAKVDCQILDLPNHAIDSSKCCWIVRKFSEVDRCQAVEVSACLRIGCKQRFHEWRHRPVTVRVRRPFPKCCRVECERIEGRQRQESKTIVFHVDIISVASRTHSIERFHRHAFLGYIGGMTVGAGARCPVALGAKEMFLMVCFVIEIDACVVVSGIAAEFGVSGREARELTGVAHLALLIAHAAGVEIWAPVLMVAGSTGQPAIHMMVVCCTAR